MSPSVSSAIEQHRHRCLITKAKDEVIEAGDRVVIGIRGAGHLTKT